MSTKVHYIYFITQRLWFAFPSLLFYYCYFSAFIKAQLTSKIERYIAYTYNIMIWYIYIMKRFFPSLWYIYHLTCLPFCECVWKHLSSTLSRFQLYNAVLSTVVTVLHIRSSDLIHLVTESLYPTALPLVTDHFSTFCFYELD